MITLQLLRELNVAAPSAPDRPLHVSAASGLVQVGAHFYLNADDENHLGVFSSNDHSAAGRLLRVVSGELPDGKKKRKAVKPDFESLVALPAFANFAHGALLALGSGSRETRTNAVLIGLDESGVAREASIRSVSFATLFESLQREFGDVNIEGAFVDGAHLSLLQRGNKGSGRNARIRLLLAPLLEQLASGASSVSPEIEQVMDFALGDMNGVPLGFTDAAALPNSANGGFVFTAVAEDTENSYADGACAGSVIGIVDANDRVRTVWPLANSPKVEGIAAHASATGLTLYLVTDPDDATVAAQLFTTTLATW